MNIIVFVTFIQKTILRMKKDIWDICMENWATKETLFIENNCSRDAHASFDVR